MTISGGWGALKVRTKKSKRRKFWSSCSMMMPCPVPPPVSIESNLTSMVKSVSFDGCMRRGTLYMSDHTLWIDSAGTEISTCWPLTALVESPSGSIHVQRSLSVHMLKSSEKMPDEELVEKVRSADSTSLANWSAEMI